MQIKPFDAGVELRVETDRATYLPGDEIAVRVVLKGRAETRIEEGWVGLVATLRSTYREYRGAGQRRHLARVGGSERAIPDSARFLEARTLWPGSHVERTVALTLPPTAPPTASGAIIAVGWSVRAALDVRRANDPEAETPIIVLAPRSTHADRAGRAVWLNAPAEETLDLAFDLPTRSLRPGDDLSGTLLLTPRREFDREEVSRGQGLIQEKVERAARLALDAPLAAGSTRDVAFTLPVPADACPALETERTAVRWLLRAVLDRPFRRDPVAIAEINVYNGDDAR